jgi:hypothetical protein
VSAVDKDSEQKTNEKKLARYALGAAGVFFSAAAIAGVAKRPAQQVYIPCLLGVAALFCAMGVYSLTQQSVRNEKRFPHSSAPSV